MMSPQRAFPAVIGREQKKPIKDLSICNTAIRVSDGLSQAIAKMRGKGFVSLCVHFLCHSA